MAVMALLPSAIPCPGVTPPLNPGPANPLLPCGGPHRICRHCGASPVVVHPHDLVIACWRSDSLLVLASQIQAHPSSPGCQLLLPIRLPLQCAASHCPHKDIKEPLQGASPLVRNNMLGSSRTAPPPAVSAQAWSHTSLGCCARKLLRQDVALPLVG
jgi:hypothetical protein